MQTCDHVIIVRRGDFLDYIKAPNQLCTVLMPTIRRDTQIDQSRTKFKVPAAYRKDIAVASYGGFFLIRPLALLVSSSSCPGNSVGSRTPFLVAAIVKTGFGTMWNFKMVCDRIQPKQNRTRAQW
jgi:hypothetical protein